jgi:hypothetical protein
MRKREEAAMHRRFLFPLAAGIVGLMAISPVFAAETSAAKKAPGHPTKATTSTTAAASSDPNGSGADGSGASDGTGDSTGSGGSGGKGGTAPAPGSGSGSSSSNCGAPQTEQGPAPQVGEAPQNHAAGDAGTVDVERLSPSELRIAKASPNDGWTQQVTAPSGPRVTVKFSHPGASPSVIRFAASMDQAGRIIHVRVQSCG